MPLSALIPAPVNTTNFFFICRKLICSPLFGRAHSFTKGHTASVLGAPLRSCGRAIHTTSVVYSYPSRKNNNSNKIIFSFNSQFQNSKIKTQNQNSKSKLKIKNQKSKLKIQIPNSKTQILFTNY